MSLISLGEEIRWIKQNLLTRLARTNVLPLQEVDGRWVSIVAPEQPFAIGSKHFGMTSKPLTVWVDRVIHVDMFPVAVQDYMEFVRRGEYFNERHWPLYRFAGRHRGGDEVIRKILEPTQHACAWPLLEHVPVTNITWPEAYAYAKWAGKILLNEMLWEYAALGSRRQELAKKLFSELKRRLPPENVEKAEKYLPAFSSFGCWGMLGGVKEWCGDQFAHSAYTQFAGGALDLENTETLAPRTQLNLRGYLRGDARSLQPESIARRRSLEPLESDYNIGFRCGEIKF